MQIRKIDNLGRIVIPIDIRKKLNVTSNDELEIYLQDNDIIIHKISQTSFDLEENIRKFIKCNYGNENDQILITEKNLFEISNMLDNYVRKNMGVRK